MLLAKLFWPQTKKHYWPNVESVELISKRTSYNFQQTGKRLAASVELARWLGNQPGWNPGGLKCDSRGALGSRLNHHATAC